MGNLEGKVALVTGGANGIGLAICRAFATAGALGASADKIGVANNPPPGFIDLALDVTIEADLVSAMTLVQSRFGRLDIVVANAGIVPPWRETAELDFEEWDRVFAVNVRGVAATLKAAVQLMAASGGAIVVTASINSFKAHAQQMLYTATKHAVWGIVKAAALDLGRHNIRVNAVAPGPIATEAFLSRLRRRAVVAGITETDALAAFANSNALGRLATEDEVAATVLFLASGAASGITGQLLPVEAGLG